MCSYQLTTRKESSIQAFGEKEKEKGNLKAVTATLKRQLPFSNIFMVICMTNKERTIFEEINFKHQSEKLKGYSAKTILDFMANSMKNGHWPESKSFFKALNDYKKILGKDSG